MFLFGHHHVTWSLPLYSVGHLHFLRCSHTHPTCLPSSRWCYYISDSTPPNLGAELRLFQCVLPYTSTIPNPRWSHRRRLARRLMAKRTARRNPDRTSTIVEHLYGVDKSAPNQPRGATASTDVQTDDAFGYRMDKHNAVRNVVSRVYIHFCYLA